MARWIQISMAAGILSAASVAGLVTMKSNAATAATTQTAPSSCVCSPVEKLEYKPVNPAETIARIYVAQCLCGSMTCVVTTGALQFGK